MKRNLCGIYIRAEVDGKWDSICLSDCTEEQQNSWLKLLTKEALISTINILCKTIQEIGELIGVERE